MPCSKGQDSEKTDLTVSYDVKEANNIRTSGEVLQNLNLSLYLLFLHRFQNLDDAFLIIRNIDSLKDF